MLMRWIFLLLIPFYVQAQTYELRIHKATESILLDGILEEKDWLDAEITEDFYLCRPYDSSYATLQTHVKVLFDDNFLYVGAEIMQDKKTYRTGSLKRDFDNGTSDLFVVNIDPFKDRLNGFHFAVNPFNVQREALISLGNERDTSWDNRWFSKVTNYEDKWVVEIAIPFKTLRYKVNAGENSWRINFGRSSMQALEVSTWSPVPRNFNPSDLAFAGIMHWDTPPPKPGANIAVIPYITGFANGEYPRNAENLALEEIRRDNGIGIGMDAKVAVTPSLNLDLTINPDFSQVEVDQQQTNVSRFELFFPEKRQFFIENSDLFGTFGFPNTRPFFSRRIGITRDPITGLAAPVPILAGARLSGKLTEDWRIGAMNMQTGRLQFNGESALPATNYSVLTAQRKVFTRSIISGIFVNQSQFGEGKGPSSSIGGIEFNYYSEDNKWQTETYFHQSFNGTQDKGQSSWANYIGYNNPNLSLNLGISHVGENYSAPVGFVPRTGVYNIFRPQEFTFFPKNPTISKQIVSYGFGMDGSDVFSSEGKLLDSENAAYLFLNTQTRAEFAVGYFWAFTHLFSPFDPVNSTENPDPDFSRGVVPLPVGDYRYGGVYVEAATPRRNDLQFSGDYYRGGFFNGTGQVLNASLLYRWQPYGVFSADINYTEFLVDAPYKSAGYWLIGTKAEMAFSRSLFLSTYFQYNTQANNSNINARLQWRFRPVSDIFLVYTDNYFAQSIPRYGITSWMPKNRALVLKMTWWLNL